MTTTHTTRCFLSSLGLLGLTWAMAEAENWPGFRGPTGQGISTEAGLPVEWNATNGVAWKTPIPGEGWSSPIVWGERIFLTAALQDGRMERTENFLFGNGVDGPTRIGTKSLSHRDGSTDPRLWHILIDRPANSAELKLPPLERPVLYQRGTPSP